MAVGLRRVAVVLATAGADAQPRGIWGLRAPPNFHHQRAEPLRRLTGRLTVKLIRAIAAVGSNQGLLWGCEFPEGFQPQLLLTPVHSRRRSPVGKNWIVSLVQTHYRFADADDDASPSITSSQVDELSVCLPS